MSKDMLIKAAPSDMMDDNSLQNQIILHVNSFGFEHVIENVIEAYRVRARRFNSQADKLEKIFKKGVKK